MYWKTHKFWYNKNLLFGGIMKIRDYSEIEVKLIRATHSPLAIMKQATAITMKKDFIHGTGISDDICKKLLEMNHTSLLEHVGFTFLIIGASRSFLAQITRHRMSSFTSGSQHYQDYRNYGFTVSKEIFENKACHIYFKEAIDNCLETYEYMLNIGISKEEARQVLPGGMENNLMWTVNARSLMNFLNLRLCNRNVAEMRIVARKLLMLSADHFPELFNYVGPDCEMKGKCTQGSMSCGTKWERLS